MNRIRQLLALLRDPRTPKLPRWGFALAILYLLWPADLIPDVIVPIGGLVDDAIVVLMAVRWLLKAGPKPSRSSPD